MQKFEKSAKQRTTHNGLALKNLQISRIGTKIKTVSRIGAKRMASGPML
jgi:hypothetical protein